MKFHHIGFVLRDAKKFENGLILGEKVKEVFDPVQYAKLSLYHNYSDSYIELIEPVNEKSFTWNFVQKNQQTPFHHLCYSVDTIEDIEFIKAKYRLIHVLGPIPALLFDNKEVVFCYTRAKTIVEFLITK